MAIESSKASGYVISYRAPTAPKISVNVQSVTQEELNSAITVYDSAVAKYKANYSAMVGMGDYVSDRFLKDLCASCEGLTSGGINYESNTITLHEKANEVYTYAVNNTSLTSVSSINAISSRFDNFYSAYYMDDEQTSCILQPSFGSAVTYDTRAYTFSASVPGISANSVFILDNPNAKGNSCVYVNYSGTTPKYSLSYERGYETGETTSADVWIVKDITTSDATAVCYSVSQNLEDADTWVEVE